jgi:uncharacterized membrane protein
MIWLVLGVLLWSFVHLTPSVARPFRASLIERLGDRPYQGLFTLAIIASIVLMVVGWRSSVPVPVYAAPGWGRIAAEGLMLVAPLLFVASGLATNIKRVVRHPQLTGVAVWAGGHLLANGDQRSLVLFGGLAVWALVAIATINRRDGEWARGGTQPWAGELKLVGIATVAYAVLFFAHPYIAGVSP